MNGLGRVNHRLASAVREAGQIFAHAAPGLTLRVTSGYRSEASQRALAEQWARGDRVGLTSKPAVNSRHTRGLAVDLAFSWRGKPVPVTDTPEAYFSALAGVLAPAGVRRLGVNHFEID